MRDELIADCHCIVHGFHRNAGIFDTREVEEVGAGAERKDQLIVRQLVTMTIQAVGDGNSLAFEIESTESEAACNRFPRGSELTHRSDSESRP